MDMETAKMDFTAGQNSQGCKKVDSIVMRGKSKMVKVFSNHRYDKGTPWKECFINQYIKTW